MAPSLTVHDAIEAAGFGRFQVLLGLFCGFAWMADSMEIMLISILPPAFVCEWGISVYEQALVLPLSTLPLQALGTTCMYIGLTLSSPFWGWFCDTHGRRKGLFISGIGGCLFGILTSFSSSFLQFVFLRTLVGAAIGGVPQTTTLYSEFLPTERRAGSLMIIQGFFTCGTWVEAVVALVVVPVWGWRGLVVASSLPLGLFALSCWVLPLPLPFTRPVERVPESARFHISHGEGEKAMEVLRRVFRANGKRMPGGEIVVEEGTKERGSIRGLLSWRIRKTTILIWIIWLCCSFSNWGVILYTPKYLQVGGNCVSSTVNGTAAHSECRPLSQQDYLDLATTSFSEIPGLLFTFLIIDKLGRRRSMALQAAIYSIASFFLASMCLSREWVLRLIFVIRAVGASLFQTVYVYTPEVYSTSLRATGLGMATMASRVGGMASPLVAQVVASHSLSSAPALYGLTSLVAVVASLALPIETAGRKLRDTHA